MSLSVAQGFTKSLAMTVLSEIGDKTFFAAATRLSPATLGFLRLDLFPKKGKSGSIGRADVLRWRRSERSFAGCEGAGRWGLMRSPWIFESFLARLV
ncbi:GDT1-like protein 5 [Capsicum chinense]|nr:GDT1-like protein 5 [Capsicum chinense]